LNGTVELKEPSACNEEERREFARLVREGFSGSDGTLLRRIDGARMLAFCYATDDSLAAIAGLKAPDERYRRDLFEKAFVPGSVTQYNIELGWVYVVPPHRGEGIAKELCRRLVILVPWAGVFATTRAGNAPMIQILKALGFDQAGKPYSRREEKLVVYLRS
jgi:GNAT superfamily N-acetyltransferase